MHDLDEVFSFIIDALGSNASRGHGSVVTIRIAPYIKKDRAAGLEPEKIITPDDVLDAHEALERFDGDFRKLFETKTN